MFQYEQNGNTENFKQEASKYFLGFIGLSVVKNTKELFS